MKTKLGPLAVISLSFLFFAAIQERLYSQTFTEERNLALQYTMGFGARAIGMGGAFISIADDGTAASWNPAGLGQIQKMEFTIVSSYSKLTSSYPPSQFNFILSEEPDPYFAVVDSYEAYKSKHSIKSFEYINFVFPFKIRKIPITIQVGYKRAINLSMNETYRANYEEKLIIGPNFEASSFIEEMDCSYKGGFDVFSFSAGAEVLPGLFFGFSLNKWFHKQTEFADFQTVGLDTNYQHQAQTQIEYDFSGFNFAIGGLYHFSRKISFGFVYSNPFSMHVDYSLDRERTYQEEAFDTLETSGDWDLKWPAYYGAGFSFRPIKRIIISLDVVHALWKNARERDRSSTQTRTYISNGSTTTQEYFTKELTFPGESRDFGRLRNTTQIRTGVEYCMPAGKISVPVRAGFFSDPDPLIDIKGDKVNLVGFTAGSGISLWKIAVDFAYVLRTGKINRLVGVVQRESGSEREFKKESYESHKFIVSAAFFF